MSAYVGEKGPSSCCFLMLRVSRYPLGGVEDPLGKKLPKAESRQTSEVRDENNGTALNLKMASCFSK